MRFFLLLFTAILIFYCTKPNPVEDLRDVKEQAMNDDEAIIAYLKSHYYNNEDFSSDGSNNTATISIDTIDADASSKTSLYDQIFTNKNGGVVTIPIESNGEMIDHKLYYVRVFSKNIATDSINGKPVAPTVADSVYASYKGVLLNRTQFDESSSNVWLNALGTVRGFRESLPLIGRGNIQDNADGSVTFTDFGRGIFIMPSNLAYFQRSFSNIPAYSPLVFIINLYTYVPDTDHDSDGVPSIKEDVNGDKIFTDDTDGDGVFNYLDIDDDNDGILTSMELTDADNNGVLDYLENNNN